MAERASDKRVIMIIVDQEQKEAIEIFFAFNNWELVITNEKDFVEDENDSICDEDSAPQSQISPCTEIVPCAPQPLVLEESCDNSTVAVQKENNACN